MSADWQEIRLGDVSEIRRGSSPRPIVEYLSTSSGMPWVKISDATGDESRFINKTKEFIRHEGVARSVIVNEGDLILSNSGTAGLPKFMGITACIHDGWQVFKSLNGIDKNFLYYTLLNIRRALLHNAYDNVLTNLTLDMLRDARVRLPPLHIQKEIANTLLDIDDKIELNRKQNRTLEVIAQTLFKRWFVEFEFPNENGQPYKSSGGAMQPSELGEIPLGWEVKPLDQIADYLNGLALQKFPPEGDEYLPAIKIREMKQGITANSDKASIKLDPKYIVDDGDVLFSWSGSLVVDIWCHGKGALNQHLFKVTSDIYPKWFYYLWTRYHLRAFQAVAADKATTMGHIQRTHLTEALTVCPPSESIPEINEIFEPLIDKIISTRIESMALAKIRDTLLPKLMSGELRVGAR